MKPVNHTARALLLLGLSGITTILAAALGARREAAARAARASAATPADRLTDTSAPIAATAGADAETGADGEKSPISPCSPPCRDRSATVAQPCENSAILPDVPVFASKNEELAHLIGCACDRRTVCIPCPEYDPVGYPHIHAVWLEGVEMEGVPTRVFAFIGFPEGASAEAPVPGVVLQHGGGGFAYPMWVDIWNRRGYAAIAVGNTGYRPARTGLTDFYAFDGWTHEVPAEAAGAWILPPDNDGMYTAEGPIDRMWMYHAVTQTIRANSLLRADPRVDADRIGLTGISWGGVIASIAIGYDPRLAFAVPVYGSGYLQESLSWMKDHFNAPGVAGLWEASLRLREVRMPVLWLAWTKDPCFSINTNCRSCADTVRGERCFLPELGHDHPRGWTPAEIYRFADACTGRGEPLVGFVTQPEAGESRLSTDPDGTERVTVVIRRPTDATRLTARLLYLTEPLRYSEASRIESEWLVGKAYVKGNTVTAVLPPAVRSYYMEVTAWVGHERYVSCSRYVERAER